MSHNKQQSHKHSNKNFIVIGNPIAHSKSPEIHQAFAEQVGINIHYARQYCPDTSDCFTAVIQAFFNGGGIGANVTVPFKQHAYQLCIDNLTPYAQVAGAVNTLYVQDEHSEDTDCQGDVLTSKLCGHNTDGLGLVNHLNQLGWELTEKKVAIIGAGGASRGVILPLLSAGVSSIHIANRTMSKADIMIAECQSHQDNLPVEMATLLKNATLTSGSIENLTGHYDVVINATSIGLSSDKLPLSDSLTCTHAYDMMYGRELPFLQHFKEKGAEVSDGYGMLIAQAALSFELWTDAPLDIDTIDFDTIKLA